LATKKVKVILTHAREKVATICNRQKVQSTAAPGFPVLEKFARFLALNGFSFAPDFGRTGS
jgi:hypothetical protein